MNQSSLFNQQSTIVNRQSPQAESSGARWQKRALDFLRGWAMTQNRFSAEVVRAASTKYVRHPPTSRAWEAVLGEAAKRGWIRQISRNLWQSNHTLGEP